MCDENFAAADSAAGTESAICLHENAVTLTYDPATETLDAGTAETAKTITVKAS